MNRLFHQIYLLNYVDHSSITFFYQYYLNINNKHLFTLQEQLIFWCADSSHHTLRTWETIFFALCSEDVNISIHWGFENSVYLVFLYPGIFWWDLTVLAGCVNICISITAGLFVNQGVSEAWKEMIEVKGDVHAFFRNASLYLTACEKRYVAMVTPPSTNALATLSDFSTWWKRIFTLMSRVYEQKGEIVSKQTRRWRRLSFWPFFL